MRIFDAGPESTEFTYLNDILEVEEYLFKNVVLKLELQMILRNYSLVLLAT